MRIEYEIGENERKMAERMYDMVEEIVHELGAEPMSYKRGALDKMGSAIHEHGTVRMGADPKTSALNDRCQMHEVRNVFVVDGSAFPTATEKNPTLTIPPGFLSFQIVQQPIHPNPRRNVRGICRCTFAAHVVDCAVP